MRRLPIFFLLDASESMIGAPLASLEEGVTRIVTSLRKDPHALETVYISVIAFAGKAEVVSPLIDLTSYYPPRLPIGGGTALGAALNVLMKEIDNKVKKQTKEEQGDWEPLVFLITDGVPTDQPNAAIERWKKNYDARASIVAITLGHGADIKLLKQLTPDVLTYEGSTDEEFRRFIDWITASVKTQSQNIEQGQVHGRGIQLAKTVKELIDADGELLSKVKQDCVVLSGRCQTTRRPYLIKYTQKYILESLRNHAGKDSYILDGCFPVTEDYFSWTEEGYKEEVNTELLEGTPGCLYCGNCSAIALCGHCENLMCVNGPGEAICPWCNEKNNFIAGGGNFNLHRGQG